MRNRIFPNFWYILWTIKPGGIALPGDLPKSLYPTAAEARAAFKKMHPNDIVIAVLGSDGRFAG
ncbi:hypothetical protein [Roseovarius sp. A-2]|uniref:hypothetical protein n=1 Tax=Roseovarius sp. A-2 TaxID=1570360 RepID=UPI0009B51625|nr:hypothetical protein [Roseovarius sp. A-2]